MEGGQCHRDLRELPFLRSILKGLESWGIPWHDATPCLSPTLTGRSNLREPNLILGSAWPCSAGSFSKNGFCHS